MTDSEKTEPMIPTMVSDCCDAPLEAAHKDAHEGQTNFMLCSKCKKSCGFKYVVAEDE